MLGSLLPTLIRSFRRCQEMGAVVLTGHPYMTPLSSRSPLVFLVQSFGLRMTGAISGYSSEEGTWEKNACKAKILFLWK